MDTRPVLLSLEPVDRAGACGTSAVLLDWAFDETDPSESEGRAPC